MTRHCGGLLREWRPVDGGLAAAGVAARCSRHGNRLIEAGRRSGSGILGRSVVIRDIQAFDLLRG